MSDLDLLIRSTRDIGISDGRIVALGGNLSGSAAEEIDATALTIFPGAIDAHVHFNEPGRTQWEGFATGSRAAAAGGTTTLFDMPLNAHPPTVDGASFNLKRAAAETSSLVDFGLWGGLVPGNVDQFETLRDRGVVGLKAFMSNSGIDDFAAVDDATLWTGMKRAAELGMLVAVHAESEKMTRDLTQQAVAAGRTTVRGYLASRPVAAEEEAIRRAIDMAAESGCRLHILHVSCGSGVRLIAKARAGGVDVTCETCPHYLVLTDEDMVALGAIAKCAPPLRSTAEQQGLRAQLADVSTIGSDHSPSPPEMKQRDNFFEVWGGISGCQHLLPLLFGGDNSLSNSEIMRLTSSGVAERFRIGHKGGIEIGKDADLTLVDAQAEESVTADSLQYRHQQSPYVGRKLRGRVVRTFLRGQTVYDNGNFPLRSCGRFVRPD
ncbi:MAG: allantoinase AllB [Chthoniobacterales bacterium]|nr:allantoinase AllB [Chthoniobacterales bacterium]